MFSETLAKNWWLLVLRGGLAILFGIAAFMWPGLTLVALVLLFGAYALVDGIFAMGVGLSHRGTPHWWLMVLEGLVGVAVGVVTLVWPGITAWALLYLVATWAVLTGVLEIITAIRLRKVIANEWQLALSGGLSILLGVLLVVWPAASALAAVWLIGAYAMLFGALLIGLGFKVRHQQTPTNRGAMHPA